MATARLIASANSVTSNVTITGASNMYANIDSDSTASITCSSKDTSAHYFYLNGFNLTSIPNTATVSSFTVKVRGYESSLSTSTTSTYLCCLVNGTSAISGTTASENWSSSAKTITIPTGSLTWSQIYGYGSDFGIRLCYRRSNKNQQGTLYIYGAEIEVTYTDGGSTNKMFLKVNGSWVQASKVYKKVNGSWVEQSDLTNVFDSNTNYIKS